jgi:hypothetical protein
MQYADNILARLLLRFHSPLAQAWPVVWLQVQNPPTKDAARGEVSPVA